MKTKYVLGIIIPVIILVVLVFLSGNNVGFTTSEEYVDSLKLTQLVYRSGEAWNYAPAITITIANDYFLPRTYQLPKFTACLSDRENVKAMESLSVTYSEGRYVRNREAILYDTARSSRGSFNIELGANAKRDVTVSVTPKQVYSYKNEQSTYLTYNNYDELLLVRHSDERGKYYYYNFCNQLTPGELASAVVIPLDKSDFR